MSSYRLWLILAVLVVGFLLGSALVLDRYGGLNYWPGLVTGFGSTLIAVFLAFEIERRREAYEVQQAAKETNEVRSTEARKRLLTLSSELRKNRQSLVDLETGLSAPIDAGVFPILHPQLLDAAWTASGQRLGDLLANYELVADLSTLYGRLEELRWRIRYRTQAVSRDLDGMTLALVREMKDEADDLLTRVESEERGPSVRPIGLDHFARLSGAVHVSATIDAEKLAAGEQLE